MVLPATFLRPIVDVPFCLRTFCSDVQVEMSDLTTDNEFDKRANGTYIFNIEKLTLAQIAQIQPAPDEIAEHFRNRPQICEFSGELLPPPSSRAISFTISISAAAAKTGNKSKVIKAVAQRQECGGKEV